jgi:hypothetical protein
LAAVPNTGRTADAKAVTAEEIAWPVVIAALVVEFLATASAFSE